MADEAGLYDRDFFAWTQQQAGRIRAVRELQLNLLVDWAEVAEEIDDLGKSLERELQSRLTTVIEHLLKLQFSPASDPRPGWQDTIMRERADIEILLAQSPSLGPRVPILLGGAQRTAVKLASGALQRRDEIDQHAARMMADQVLTEDLILGGWLPEPVAVATR